MTTYEEATAKARLQMKEDGDTESLRLAVGECIDLAPDGGERAYWKRVAGALAQGRTAFKTKV